MTKNSKLDKSRPDTNCIPPSNISRLNLRQRHNSWRRLHPTAARLPEALTEASYMAGYLAALADASGSATVDNARGTGSLIEEIPQFFVRFNGYFYRKGGVGRTRDLALAGCFTQSEANDYKSRENATIRHISKYIPALRGEIKSREDDVIRLKTMLSQAEVLKATAVWTINTPLDAWAAETLKEVGDYAQVPEHLDQEQRWAVRVSSYEYLLGDKTSAVAQSILAMDD